MKTVQGHQINVTPACADAGSTRVLKRKNVYQENALVNK